MTRFVFGALFLLGCGAASVRGTSSDAGTQAEVSATQSGATYERPIDLVFKIHFEPQTTLDQYKKRRDDIEAVRAIAEKYGIKLSIHGNGEFWQYAKEQGDEPIVRKWLANGHIVGPHMHAVYEVSNHSWRTATFQQTADEAFVDDLWKQHEKYLTALLPDVKITSATPFDTHDEQFVSRMNSRGYTIVGGGKEEISEQWLGHHPFHPWRVGGTFLEEDLSSKVILVTHYSQFLEQDYHGALGSGAYADQSLAHHKVGFLQIYLNRLYAERTGEPLDKVWSYGFMTHDTKSPADTRAEIEKYIVWVTTNFGQGKKSARGNVILKPSTMQDVYDDFVGWEKEHPNTSSFNVKTPTVTGSQSIDALDESQRKAIYPGPFWGMAELLRADEANVADYVTQIDTFAAAGVSCHEIAVGPRGDTKRTRRFILWKETDGDAVIDMMSLTSSANVVRWNVRDKTSSSVAAIAIAVGGDPVIVDVSGP